jgi:glutamate:GABA antiporter
MSAPASTGPAKAMIVCLILGLLAGVIFVLPTTAAVAFLFSSAAIAIILLFPITVVGIALITYRSRKSAEFKSSVIANSYLGGAIYYLAAIVTIVYSLIMFYEYITVPAIFGSAGTEGLELIFIPIIILFVIYFGARAINKNRGVDFDRIFTEIPPE